MFLGKMVIFLSKSMLGKVDTESQAYRSQLGDLHPGAHRGIGKVKPSVIMFCEMKMAKKWLRNWRDLGVGAHPGTREGACAPLLLPCAFFSIVMTRSLILDHRVLAP